MSSPLEPRRSHRHRPTPHADRRVSPADRHNVGGMLRVGGCFPRRATRRQPSRRAYTDRQFANSWPSEPRTERLASMSLARVHRCRSTTYGSYAETPLAASAAATPPLAARSSLDQVNGARDIQCLESLQRLTGDLVAAIAVSSALACSERPRFSA